MLWVSPVWPEESSEIVSLSRALLSNQITVTVMSICSFSPPLSFITSDKLQDLEDKTGLSKVYFFVGFTALFSLLLFLAGGAKLMVDLAGFVYPAYMSFKALDTPDSEDDIQWLTYWVVFATFSILEQTIGFITDFIPMYFYLKIAFFVWLYHPQFKGATVLYSKVIRPLVLPYLNKKEKVEKKVS
jgi:receptor expression-enhancing protein 5/6